MNEKEVTTLNKTKPCNNVLLTNVSLNLTNLINSPTSHDQILLSCPFRSVEFTLFEVHCMCGWNDGKRCRMKKRRRRWRQVNQRPIQCTLKRN